MREGPVHPLAAALPLDGILRIDAGLEGDWSGSVVCVWTREDGFRGFDDVVRERAGCTPSLELYFEGAWLGVHCYRTAGAGRVFDEDQAHELIRYVEGRLEKG